MTILLKDDLQVLMKIMLPAMFTLFSDKQTNEYKSTFKKPCEFNSLLALFATLPNYFNEMGKLYADKPDLLAYYSMQLASGFLVSNGSLTMDCLFKMLDLQSRLGNFSIDLMDNPERNYDLIGKFGLAMKPMMAQMKQDPMLRIIEQVDKYDKTNDPYVITLFHRFNIVFVVISLIGILFNIVLILVLRRVNIYNKESSIQKVYKSLKRKYKTSSCVVLISMCHIGYLLINFIIMSQAKLAGLSLGSLNESNFACKLAFTLFAPTSIYNILHQLAIWILCYALYQNSSKIRKLKLIDTYSNDGESTSDYYEYEQTTNYYDTHLLTNENHGFLKAKQTHKSNGSKRDNKVFGCFNVRHKNKMYCFLIFMVLALYNSPNMILYGLNKLEYPSASGHFVSFCAFEPNFSFLFTLLTTQIQPILNLSLFVYMPSVICCIIVMLDACFLIRVFREDEKRFKKFKNNLEITLYVYFGVFLASQLVYALHSTIDLMRGANKFPFVLPIFIGMTFSSAPGLFVFEMLMICIAYSSDFFIWFVADRKFRQLVLYLFKKHVLCRSDNINTSLIVADRPRGIINRNRKFSANKQESLKEGVNELEEEESSVDGKIKHSSTASTTSTDSHTISKPEAIQKMVNVCLVQAEYKSNLLMLNSIDDMADDIDVNIQKFISKEINGESLSNDYSIPRTYIQKV